MSMLLLIDRTGGRREELGEAFAAAGWNVTVKPDASGARGTAADAIVLVAEGDDLAPSLQEVQAARRLSGTPVALVTDVDRAGWARTFGAAGAPEVEAFFEGGADAGAVVSRLGEILCARESARKLGAAGPAAILERAVANEEAAAAFYRRAARCVSDPVTRDALQGLMRDEEEHKRIILEFRSGRRPVPEGIARSTSIVESFGAPSFQDDLSPADAFLLAAQQERLAVVFYESWAKLYPQCPERDLLLHLADMERGHKTKVEAMFTNAAFPEAW